MIKLKFLTYLISVIILFVIITPASSCYFTNCPWGGKRSIIDTETRRCPKCANGNGTCFGPKICCLPSLGCLMDTKMSKSCEFEDNESALPCEPYGKQCYTLKYGRCATKNLCCNASACAFDSLCHTEDDELNDNSQPNIIYRNEEEETNSKDIKKIIKYLIKKLQEKDSSDNMMLR